jgi:hypothetical protein
VGRRIRALILVAALIAAGIFAGSALSNWWSVPGADAAVATAGAVAHRFSAAGGRVRVEVLNAAGRPNLARQATDALRDDGFDVVFFGNAAAGARGGPSTEPAGGASGEPESEPSVVIDRVGRIELARSVADALGIRAVKSEPDSNLYVDVSVRLVEDWTKPARGAAAPAPPPPAWWDIRRFLHRERRPAPSASGTTLADPAAARPATSGAADK